MPAHQDTPIMDSISLLIWAIGSLLGKTWRVSITFQPPFDPLVETSAARIYCLWHSHLLPISYILRDTGKTAIVSSSKDGVRAAQVAKMWKHGIIHGSSSKGGSTALRQSLRYLSDNKSIAITPDGPRGPKEVVKAGVAQIASLSGAPVITLKIKALNSWQLNSWDRFIIPKPFSKIHFTASEPIWAKSTSDQNDPIESFRLLIQERLKNDDHLA
jgi:hypothetical protein